MTRRWIPLLAAVCLLLTPLLETPLLAQDGKTIWGDDTRSTLRAMKEVQRALGVRSCLHCHVKQDGKVDYTVETPNKELARRMHFAFVDTLSRTGKATLDFAHGEAQRTLSVTRRTVDKKTSLSVSLVLPGAEAEAPPTTLTATIPLPTKDAAIDCNTCHAGTLHFLTGHE